MGIRSLISKSAGWVAQKFESPYMPEFGLNRLDVGDKKMTRPYSQHPYVYRCISDIATKCASVPLELRQGPSDNYRVLEDGPLYRVFTKPNQLWSGTQLIEATMSHLMLQGNAVWFLDREDERQEPVEIWALEHSRFTPVFWPGSWNVQYWKYQSPDGSVKVNLAPWNVLLFRLFNPYSDFWGMGPMEATRRGVELDWWASKYNEAFFIQGGDPGGIIKIKNRMNDKQKRDLLRSFTDAHGGALQAFKTALLDGDAEYQQLTTTHKDMAFLGQMQFRREVVCNTFGTPPSEIGIHDKIHKAASKEMLKTYWTGRLLPLLGLVCDSLRSQFFVDYDEEYTWPHFDTSGVAALQDDLLEKAKIAQIFVGLGFPVSDVNDKLDLPFERFEGDDVPRLPPTAADIAALSAPPADGKTYYVVGPPELLRLPGPTVPAQPKGAPDLPPHTPVQRQHWLDWIAKGTPPAKRFQGALRKFLRSAIDEFDRILAVAREGGATLAEEIGAVALGPEYATTLGLMARKHYQATAVAMGPLIERHIANAGISFDFDPSAPAIKSFLETKEMKIVENVYGKGLNDAARARLVLASEQGLTIGELAEDLHQTVGVARTRALRIARTETAQAANGVEFHAERAAGITKHAWIASLDDETRDEHIADMNLGPWPVGRVFPNSGCKYPGDVNGAADQVINCRCTIMAVE